jgi:peptide/nickel transport system substrate-binding protein
MSTPRRAARRARSRLSRREFLAAGGALLGAAAVRSARPAAAAPASGAANRSGQVIAAVSERALTLDPADHYSISSTSVLRHIFDPLIDVTNDSKFVPALAESWEVQNATTWRFTLRRGVTFHDGSPLNADSVVYTLRRVRDNTRLIKAFVYQDLDAVEKESDYAVRVTTKHPFGSLPSHLTMLGILPASAAGREEAFFQRPVGTGPFRFVGWTRGERVDLAANPNYWKTGVPKVERATFRFVPELSTRAAGLRAGEFHVIDRLPPDMVQTLRASPGVRVESVLGLEVQQWLFQMAREPDKNVLLRRAISLGIDRNTIIKEFMLGFARAAVCPVPPGLIGYVDLGVKPYDPDRAKSYLRQAGYTGEPLDFVLMKDLYPKQLEIAQAVQAMLSGIGVRLNLKNMEIATARQMRTAGSYDIFYSGWAHLPHDPDWYFGQWFTRAGAAQLSRFDDPKVEQLVIEARSPDPKVRQQRYEDLERILWREEEPTIWPFYSRAIYGVRSNVRNYQARSDYYVLLSEVSVA